MVNDKENKTTKNRKELDLEQKIKQLDAQLPTHQNYNSENWEQELVNDYVASKDSELQNNADSDKDDDQEINENTQCIISTALFRDFLNKMKNFASQKEPSLINALKNVELLFDKYNFSYLKTQSSITSFFKPQ